MTLTQTVDIPIDRRVHLDFEVPREIPTGAKVEFKVIPFVKKEAKAETSAEKSPEKAIPKGKIGMTRKELEEHLKNAHTPISDSLTGILAGLGDITAEQVREMRLREKYGEYFE